MYPNFRKLTWNSTSKAFKFYWSLLCVPHSPSMSLHNYSVFQDWSSPGEEKRFCHIKHLPVGETLASAWARGSAHLGKCPFPIPWKRRATQQGFWSPSQILFCTELLNLLSAGFSLWAQFSSWDAEVEPQGCTSSWALLQPGMKHCRKESTGCYLCLLLGILYHLKAISGDLSWDQPDTRPHILTESWNHLGVPLFPITDPCAQMPHPHSF